MNIVQGAMLGGTILSEKEFKEVLLELLKNEPYEKELVRLVKLALSRYQRGDINGLYNAIEELEVKLFQNPATSLMIITNLKSSVGNYTWAWNHSEKNTIKNSGAIDYTKALKNSIIEKKYTDALSKHLQDMIKYVESTKMDNEDYNKLFKSGNYRFGSKDTKVKIGERAGDKEIHGKTLAYIFYGDMSTPHRQGKIADAFLNHLGNMHKSLFGNFTFNPNFILDKSVASEEGSNFYQLLIDSGNNTGWQTGGDLILLSGNNIIANIQLKTIQNAEQNKVGTISTDEISKNLQKLKDFTENGRIYNHKVFVDICYNIFKTSGILHDVEKRIEELPIEYAKKKLSGIQGITFS